MKNKIENTTVHHEDEIDLIELVKTVWGGRKIIVQILIAFTVVGLVVAVLSPKEYTASTTLV